MYKLLSVVVLVAALGISTTLMMVGPQLAKALIVQSDSQSNSQSQSQNVVQSNGGSNSQSQCSKTKTKNGVTTVIPC